MSEAHWSLTYDLFVPERQGLREALCTLGNGYFATRGAFSEAESSDHHYPGTYLAGGYNRLCTERFGRVIENEDLVNLPNWLSLRFRIDDGEWIHPGAVEMLSFRQELDLASGVLSRSCRFRDAHGRTTSLSEKRLVHIEHFHMAALEQVIVAEDWSGRLEIRSALDGTVTNAGVPRYRDLNQQHLKPLAHEVIDDHLLLLKVETSSSELRIAESARTRILVGEEAPALATVSVAQPGFVAQQYAFQVREGDVARVEKVVALYTSRDAAISECGHQALKAASSSPSFSELFATQRLAWRALWNKFDIGIEMRTETSTPHPLLILRLHIFHLLQTVSMHATDFDVGVPARGWHGEAYRGHIFWDELFIFPFLNLRSPKMTRALLSYRFRRLDRARESARASKLQGALFPWQSGSTGREESQHLHLNPKSGRWIPDHSHLQRHVNGAIAYNVWQYYEASQDLDFLIAEGAEIILEIARLLASLCTYHRDLQRYEILRVVGPDEYHDAYPDDASAGIDNNAYTNILTVWTLRKAREVEQILPEGEKEALLSRLKLKADEIEAWDEIAKGMRLVFHGDEILSQFEGYDKLEEFPWDVYRARYGDIHRLDRILELEGDTTNRYQVSKQADVLMLFYLFSTEELSALFAFMGYPFDSAMIPKNIDYYAQRTAHGSTLSNLVHSWVEARAERATSWELFVRALHSDVADVQGGTTAEGIHLGAMAGSVDLVQRGYAGLKAAGDCLQMNPKLPDALERIRLHVYYRRHALTVDLTRAKVTVVAKQTIAPPICLSVSDQLYELCSGDTLEVELER